MTTAAVVALLLAGCQTYESPECGVLATGRGEPVWQVACTERLDEGICGHTFVACADNPTFCASGYGAVTSNFGDTRIDCADGQPICPNGNTAVCVFVPYDESFLRGATGEIPEQCGGRVLEHCE